MQALNSSIWGGNQEALDWWINSKGSNHRIINSFIHLEKKLPSPLYRGIHNSFLSDDLSPDSFLSLCKFISLHPPHSHSQWPIKLGVHEGRDNVNSIYTSLCPEAYLAVNIFINNFFLIKWRSCLSPLELKETVPLTVNPSYWLGLCDLFLSLSFSLIFTLFPSV